MIDVPIRTVSEANSRDHWAKKARRVKAQRDVVGMYLGIYFSQHRKPSLPCVVRLTRSGGRHLDDDNLRSALKAVRDEVAKWLNINDGGTLVKWEYAERKAKTQSVIIEWESCLSLIHI